MRNLTIILMCLVAVGCSTSEKSVREILKKNPEIVFDSMKADPEGFIEAVNSAMQSAQKKQQEKSIAKQMEQEEQEFKNPKKPKLSNSRLLYGSADAPVKIVEYADFQCPACSMAAENLNTLVEKHPGKIALYYKHMPLSFHKEALPAALYYEAIRSESVEKAREFYTLLFRNQNQLGEAFFKKTIQKLKLDYKKIAKLAQGEKIKSLVAEDQAEFEEFGFTGTPAIVVNGISMFGAQPVEQMERIIERTSKK